MSSPVGDKWAKIENEFEFAGEFLMFIGLSVLRTETFFSVERVSADPARTEIFGEEFVQSFFE